MDNRKFSHRDIPPYPPGVERDPEPTQQPVQPVQTAPAQVGVDQNGDPATGYSQPQSWGSGWADKKDGTASTPGLTKPGKFDRWLHKATSHPGGKSGESGDLRELKQERERKKLRRRSGQMGSNTNIAVVNE